MRLTRTSVHTLWYGVKSPLRFVYGFFLCILSIGWIDVLRTGDLSISSIFPLLIVLVTIFGIGYREFWIFDSQSQSISYGIGWFFYVKKKVYAAKEISHIEISHFIKGQHPQTIQSPRGRNYSMTVCALVTKKDERIVIETIAEKKSMGYTESVAKQISSFMDIRLQADREAQFDQPFSFKEL